MATMIVATAIFVFGIAPALSNEAATEPKTFWCVNLEEKQHIDKVCHVYIWNPDVISGDCTCDPGFTLFNPDTDIELTIINSPKASGS